MATVENMSITAESFTEKHSARGKNKERCRIFFYEIWEKKILIVLQHSKINLLKLKAVSMTLYKCGNIRCNDDVKG